MAIREGDLMCSGCCLEMGAACIHAHNAALGRLGRQSQLRRAAQVAVQRVQA